MSLVRHAEADDVKLKISKKEFSLADDKSNQNRFRSFVWKTFRQIKDQNGAILTSFVCCSDCQNVLHYPPGQSTSNMRKHPCIRDKIQATEASAEASKGKSLRNFFTVTLAQAKNKFIERNEGVGQIRFN